MLNKITDAIDVFRYGEQVANPAAWKVGGNIATVLPTLLMALVKLAGDYGYGIQLSTEDASSIGLGISAVVMLVVNNVSSVHSGLLPAKQVAAEPTSVEQPPAELVAPTAEVAPTQEKPSESLGASYLREARDSLNKGV